MKEIQAKEQYEQIKSFVQVRLGKDSRASLHTRVIVSRPVQKDYDLVDYVY